MLQVTEASILFQDEAVDLSQFRIETQLESTSSRVINFDFKHKTDFVHYAGAKYGPIIELKLRNLDIKILSEVVNTLSNMPAYQRNLMMPMLVMQHSRVFLAHSPSFEIPRLDIQTDEGTLNARLRLGVKPFRR